MPPLGNVVDERFLTHRLRSTSAGGVAGALVAGGLFFYRLLARHVVSWDLFAVVAAIAAFKVGAMIWYRLRD
jgi:hypothetical protein